MNENGPFTHEERPPYQRENIDLAIQSISQFLGNLGIETSGYDPNLFIYVHDYEYGGRYDTQNDQTYIDSKHSFNTKVHIHEGIHAFSSDFRCGQFFDGRLRAGFHIQHTDNYGNFQSHNSGLNEGLTQLLTLEVICRNFSEIQDYRKRYKRIMVALHNYDTEIRQTTSGYIGAVCENTGWYSSYFHEMSLVNSILDLVAFERSKGGGDFEKHRENIWNDLIVAYFLGDFKILRSVLKEADSSGSLKQHIHDLKAKSSGVSDLTNSIEKHITEIFDPQYQPSPIPQKLD